MAVLLDVIDIGGKSALVSVFGISGVWAWFISLAIGIIFFVIFLIIMIFTGGITVPFLMAKFLRKPIIAILRKDKKIMMGAVNYNQGLASTKKYGEFIIQPESIYMWPTGILGFIAYADYGTSLPVSLVRAANVLKNNDFSDYDQLESYNKEIKKQDSTDQLKVKLPETTYRLDDPMLTAPKKQSFWRFGK